MRAVVSSIVAVVVLTVVFGFAYPLVMTGFAQVAFKDKANGSLISVNGKVVGSKLAAQEFTRPKYFHERPSATAPAYNAGGDDASRTSGRPTPSSPRTSRQPRGDPEARGPVQPGPHDRRHPRRRGHDLRLGHRPAHLAGVRASSRRAAIAAVRELPLATVQQLIDENTDGRWLGFFGEPGVNVLELNLALDKERARRWPAESASIFSRELVVAAVRDSFPKLDPRLQFRNPVMFIVEIGSVITTGIFVLDLAPRRHGQPLVRRRDRVLALADGAVRELRRGDRRGPRQGAGERAPRDAHDDAAHRRARTARSRTCRRPSCSAATSWSSSAGEVIPADGEVDRRRRLGRRVGDHRRVGAGDPRGRRRPLGGHRRHEAALGPARDRGHPGARQVVPRPDDRARRGRRAAQDAERDRAQHPARRADDHVPRRGRDAAPVRDLRRHAARRRPC